MCFLVSYYGNTIMSHTSDGPNPPSPTNVGKGVSLFLGVVDRNLGIVPEGAWQVKYWLTIKTNKMVDLMKEIQFFGFLLIPIMQLH